MTEAWQVLGDCPFCHTEGAWTELHQTHASMQADCQACDATEREAVRRPGAEMTRREVARAQLEAWAHRENRTLDDWVQSTMGTSVEQSLDHYERGDVVSTTLDVMAFLFPGMSSGLASTTVHRAPTPPPPKRSARRPDDARAPAKLLVSVMLADGALLKSERDYVDAFLHDRGMPPLSPAELRPWRPHEVGPLREPDLAAATLEAAVELMHLDGVRDDSELRIVRTFARVWGIDDARVQEWDDRYARLYRPRLNHFRQFIRRWMP